MKIEIVNTASQPMLHVTRQASMDPGEISAVMGEAFGAIGSFLGRTWIKSAGVLLALYREWDGKPMQVDVGFPISPADAARAEGEVRAGQIPEGKTLKAVHRGSYAKLRETYEATEAHVKETGLKTREIAWEVYLNDPAATPEVELEPRSTCPWPEQSGPPHTQRPAQGKRTGTGNLRRSNAA